MPVHCTPETFVDSSKISCLYVTEQFSLECRCKNLVRWSLMLLRILDLRSSFGISPLIWSTDTVLECTATYVTSFRSLTTRSSGIFSFSTLVIYVNCCPHTLRICLMLCWLLMYNQRLDMGLDNYTTKFASRSTRSEQKAAVHTQKHVYP